MLLTKDEIENYEAIAGDLDFLRKGLADANDIKKSSIRQEYADICAATRFDIMKAIESNDRNALKDLEAVAQSIHLDLEEHAYAAEDLFADFFAQSILELDGVRADSLLKVINSVGAAKSTTEYILRTQWLRYGFGKELIPPEVRDIYVTYCFQMVQVRLNQFAIKMGKIKTLGMFHNGQDVPLRIIVLPLYLSAAKRAIRQYIKLKKKRKWLAILNERNNPGLAKRIWSVVGWDSYGEFLTDMGLLVISGGGSAVVRFTRKIHKAVKVKRKVGRVRKLRKVIKAEEEALENALNARRRALKRYDDWRHNAQKRKNLKKAVKEVNETVGKIFDEIMRLTRQYVKSASATKELVETIRASKSLVAGIATSYSAETLLNEATENDPNIGKIAKKEALRYAAFEKLKEIDWFGKGIEDLADEYRASLVPGVGKNTDVFWRWFGRTLTREFAVRYLEQVLRGRTFRLDTVLIDALGKTVESMLLQMTGSESVSSEIAKQLAAVFRKSSTTFLKAITNAVGNAVFD